MLGRPFPNRFAGKVKTFYQIHFGQIAQGQLITKPPEHHFKDDLSSNLATVKWRMVRSLNVRRQKLQKKVR